MKLAIIQESINKDGCEPLMNGEHVVDKKTLTDHNLDQLTKRYISEKHRGFEMVRKNIITDINELYKNEKDNLKPRVDKIKLVLKIKRLMKQINDTKKEIKVMCLLLHYNCVCVCSVITLGVNCNVFLVFVLYLHVFFLNPLDGLL